MKRKRPVHMVCEVGMLVFVSLETQKFLEQIATIMQRENPKQEWGAGDVSGRTLDALAAPLLRGIRAVLRAQKRKGRKLTEAEINALARGSMLSEGNSKR